MASWGQSVWILEKLKSLLNNQTENIQEYIQDKTAVPKVYIQKTPPTENLFTGDICFIYTDGTESSTPTEEEPVLPDELGG